MTRNKAIRIASTRGDSGFNKSVDPQNQMKPQLRRFWDLRNLGSLDDCTVPQRNRRARQRDYTSSSRSESKLTPPHSTSGPQHLSPRDVKNIATPHSHLAHTPYTPPPRQSAPHPNPHPTTAADSPPKDPTASPPTPPGETTNSHTQTSAQTPAELPPPPHSNKPQYSAPLPPPNPQPATHTLLSSSPLHARRSAQPFLAILRETQRLLSSAHPPPAPERNLPSPLPAESPAHSSSTHPPRVPPSPQPFAAGLPAPHPPPSPHAPHRSGSAALRPAPNHHLHHKHHAKTASDSPLRKPDHPPSSTRDLMCPHLTNPPHKPSKPHPFAY
jgi:hypothetical protein